MKILTDAEINYIIERASLAYKHNKLPQKRKLEFITTLKSYIQRGGIVENVCNACLGTGRGKKL